MSVNPRGWALACAITAAACGGGTTPTSPSTTGTPPVTITITSQNGAQSFSPNPASAGGQMVVFRNNDSVAHRVVLNDGSIDTGNINPGATSAAVQMPSAGTNYHCSVHPGMVGAVSGTSGQPPVCEGLYCVGY
jgi:plastocyanin